MEYRHRQKNAVYFWLSLTNRKHLYVCETFKAHWSIKKPQSDLCAEHVQKQSLITPDACICNKTVPKYSSPTRIVRKCDFDLLLALQFLLCHRYPWNKAIMSLHWMRVSYCWLPPRAERKWFPRSSCWGRSVSRLCWWCSWSRRCTAAGTTAGGRGRARTARTQKTGLFILSVMFVK